MKRSRLGLVVLLAFGLLQACSLSRFDQTDCSSDVQCIVLFGEGSVCGDDGLCTTPPDLGVVTDTGTTDTGTTTDTGVADTTVEEDTSVEDTVVEEDTSVQDDVVDEDMTADIGGEDVAEDVGVDMVVSPFEGLVINEVSAAGNPYDWFEIYNGTSRTMDMSQLFFTDDFANPSRSSFPSTCPGTINEGCPGGPGADCVCAGNINLLPQDFLIVWVNGDTFGFGLGGDEELAVYAADLTLVDAVDWLEGDSPGGSSAQEHGSYARLPNGTGDFRPMRQHTQGRPNSVCGNGIIAGLEQCDDGTQCFGGENDGLMCDSSADCPTGVCVTQDNDGCSETCRSEPGWGCVDEPSVCSLLCGNDTRNAGEDCDGEDFGSTTCVNYGMVTPMESTGLACDEMCVAAATGCEAPRGPLVINEVSSHDGDYRVELFNTGATFDYVGWTLEDDQDDADHGSITLPAETTIDAGGYHVIVMSPPDTGFILNTDDLLRLFDEDTSLRDEIDWAPGAAQPDPGTLCRIPDGTGPFVSCPLATWGATNGTGE